MPAYGNIIFYTYPGASEPHYVVIYLGEDRILRAPETGQNVGYGTLSEFPGQTAKNTGQTAARNVRISFESCHSSHPCGSAWEIW